MSQDWYALLGVPEDADDGTIRRAYRRAALKFHPDKNSSEEASEMFHLLNEAFAVLTSPGLRTEYDALQQPETNARTQVKQDFTDYFKADLQDRIARRNQDSSSDAEILQELKRDGYERRRALEARWKKRAFPRQDSMMVRTVRFPDGTTKTYDTVEDARAFLDTTVPDGCRMLRTLPAEEYSEIYEFKTIKRLKARASRF